MAFPIVTGQSSKNISFQQVNSAEIRAYNPILAFVLQLFHSVFSCIPEIIGVEGCNQQWFYLNKKELITWLNTHEVRLEMSDSDVTILSALRRVLRVSYHLSFPVELKDYSCSNSSSFPGIRLLTGFGIASDEKMFRLTQAVRNYTGGKVLHSTHRINCIGLPPIHRKDKDYLKTQIVPKEVGDLQYIHSDPYTYETVAQNTETYYVSFGDCRIGDNLRKEYLSQEDVMLMEMPELAEYALNQNILDDNRSPAVRKAILLTTPTTAVGNGIPNPLIFRNLYRVSQFHVEDVDCRETGKHQRVNVLAMSVPKLKDALLQEQTAPETLWDLFDTFVAGFTLAKLDAHQHSKPCTVCTNTKSIDFSSPFKHNSKVVFLLQLLAAQYVGVDKIELFDYSDEEKAICLGLWGQVCTEFIQPIQLENIILRIGKLVSENEKAQIAS